jgi:tRNA-dihydrouridine synthase B
MPFPTPNKTMHASPAPRAANAAALRAEPVQIGRYRTANNIFVAPMAGVTDRPFRNLCRRFGAGHAVSEMTAANPKLWGTDKTMFRLNHAGELAPVAVQIAGSDPAMLADAARYNIDRGAQIIDINMGCPAKKVCNMAAGSALLRDETLVGRILDAVVSACSQRDVPVTLKTRTGWDADSRNAMRIARTAEAAGIALLTLHGRTRCDHYTGVAEYDTIAQVKAAVSIPVIANGDIDSPEKAFAVLSATGADGVMIGRAAQGRPWIFREIVTFLTLGKAAAAPARNELRDALLEHLAEHVGFYGEWRGVRTARKHIGWYLSDMPGAAGFLTHINGIEDAQEQRLAIAAWFDEMPRQEQSEQHQQDQEKLAA